MALINYLKDVKIYIILAMITAFAIGPIGPEASVIMIVVLILQITASMEGLSFNKESIVSNKNTIARSLFCAFVICSLTTLMSGLFFYSAYPDVWKGWVILAAVPSAVSIVTLAMYLRGNMNVSVLSTAIFYIISLAVTPLMVFLLIGDAVSPLKIFQYVLLFIAIPMLATIPLKKVKINKTGKIIFINVTMFILIFIALGSNIEEFFVDMTLLFYIIVVAIVRTFGLSIFLLYMFKKAGVRRDNAITYMAFSIWKNTGLALTLCMILFSDNAQAVIPCVVVLLIDMIWFAFMTGYTNKVWPIDESTEVSNG